MHPKPGLRVRLWYKDRAMPHHGRIGEVVAPAGKGSGPKNHLVRLDCGTEVVVPAGNLNKPEESK